MSRRLAVVGGGLAGIVAALDCADGGAEVTLYEARQWLGGATFSVQRDGYTVDNGQHIALRCCTAYTDFLRRIGSDASLPIQPRLRIPVLAPGKPAAHITRSRLPAPLHLAGALLRYTPLSLGERLRALRAAAALRRLDPDDAALDGQSFGAWLRAAGQSQRAIDVLWNLIALPTINLHADDASLAVAVKVFRTGLFDRNDGADVGVPAVSLARLHGEPALAALEDAGVRVVLGTRIERLDELDDADAVVLALPHTAAAKLLPAGTIDADGLGTSAIVNLHVHYDRRVLDEPFAAAIDSPLQWLFDRTESSGVADGQLVSISLSAAQEEQSRSVATLRERFLPELERLLPAAREARVLDVAVTHEPHATFAARPGTRRLRPGPGTAVAGVYLAGAWTDTGWPATMEGAVRSGAAAARAVLTGASLASPRALAAGGVA